MKNKCKGCTERHRLCHATCEFRKEWEEEQSLRKAHIKENSDPRLIHYIDAIRYKEKRGYR